MITIYSFAACPYCNELKEKLTKENIEYNDIDVELPENKEEVDNIFKIAESDTVPIIKIGQQLLVPNVSFRSIDESVEITKKLLI